MLGDGAAASYKIEMLLPRGASESYVITVLPFFIPFNVTTVHYLGARIGDYIANGTKNIVFRSVYKNL